jgi:hypothetical protein
MLYEFYIDFDKYRELKLTGDILNKGSIKTHRRLLSLIIPEKTFAVVPISDKSKKRNGDIISSKKYFFGENLKASNFVIFCDTTPYGKSLKNNKYGSYYTSCER